MLRICAETRSDPETCKHSSAPPSVGGTYRIQLPRGRECGSIKNVNVANMLIFIVRSHITEGGQSHNPQLLAHSFTSSVAATMEVPL